MLHEIDVRARDEKLERMVLFAYENANRVRRGIPEFEEIYEEFLIHFMDEKMRGVEEFLFHKNEIDYNEAIWEIPRHFERELYERSFVMNVLIERMLFFSYDGTYYNEPNEKVW